MTEVKPKNSIKIPFPTDNKSQMLLVGLLIVASLIIGSLWTKVQYLEKGGTSAKGSATQATAPQLAPPAEDNSPQKVSVDDDPVMGDPNAKITLIEFSDYECPFCKRHFDQTLADLKKEYVDTGKVKIIYRDLPLPFHDPMATIEAVAANCAR